MDKSRFSRHIELKNVNIEDSFWSRETRLIKDEVIPYQYLALNDMVEGAEKSFSIDNFRKAAEVVKRFNNGDAVRTFPTDRWEYKENEVDDEAFHGWVFQDSDTYKWLEAVGYSLAKEPDSSLEAQADEIIDLVCSAQLDNGYLNTHYIINDITMAHTNLKDKHELYCFGHMAEAAISYYNATGKDKLLNAVCRYADLICDTFNKNGLKGYPGHEIAEMALCSLYETTDNKKYLETAEFFIRQRGTKPYYFDIERGYKRTDDSEDYHYNQAHKPVSEQEEAVGHAVRGVYLYSGMADIARLQEDKALFNACEKIWDNIQNKKLYITGGIGSTVHGEAFSFDYDLPNDLAYCETCASIGLIFFARRMLEINPDSKYADVIERALYNTVLSSMAEDGKAFFYVNPLEVLPAASHKDERKRHIKPVRQKWFGCACCPPNLARLITSLGEYCYTQGNDTFYIHQYIGGEVNCELCRAEISSDYIKNGRVNIKISTDKPFRLAMRIPEWCDKFTISEDYSTENGYAYIDISGNTSITAEFEIRVKLIKCSNRVRENVGRAAVMRGPVVYCIEEADNGDNLQSLRIDPKSVAESDGDCIMLDGFREKLDDTLYSEYKPSEYKKVKIKFIPYYRWGNRGENEMNVYVRI